MADRELFAFASDKSYIQYYVTMGNSMGEGFLEDESITKCIIR